MSAAEKITLSEAEYLALEATSEVRHAFLAGEVVAMAGGSKRHAKIASNLNGILWGALKGTPCQPVGADQRVYVVETGLYTYPDAMVGCGAWVAHEGDPGSVTNPRVIFEVVSPATEAYDRGAKFWHYRRIPSLTDYVVVMQDRGGVERYSRDVAGYEGQWVLIDCAEQVELPALGCSLALDDIYDDAEALAAPEETAS